ncbi:MAG: ImmA/IrrE family metallo-endopeptidase [Acidobacteria bacterium]|nr:ImmA/IrrE family metallo-endopeptidase [Acidobacteriota bacterium]
MIFLLDKISRLRCGWNKRPLTEADFYRLCARKKITVVEMPLATNGFYYCVKNKHFIAISTRLASPTRLLVMFHEFAHYLMHAPDTGVTANFHGVGFKTRKELEADAFALCALMPRIWIEKRRLQDHAEHENIPPNLVAERLKLFETYRL